MSKKISKNAKKKNRLQGSSPDKKKQYGMVNEIFKSKAEKNTEQPITTGKNFDREELEDYINQVSNYYYKEIDESVSMRLNRHRDDISREFNNAFSEKKLKKLFESITSAQLDTIAKLEAEIESDKDKINKLVQSSEKAREDFDNKTKNLVHREELEKAEKKAEEHYANLKIADEKINKLNAELSEKKVENEMFKEGLKSIENENEKIKQIFGSDLKYNLGEQQRMIKTIAYLLDGLETSRKSQENPESEEIYTDQFEVNVVLYISSILAEFGINSEGFESLMDSINKKLVTYKIDDPIPIDGPMDPQKHKQLNPPHDTFVKKYYSLSITHKKLNTIARKALIEAD